MNKKIYLSGIMGIALAGMFLLYGCKHTPKHIEAKNRWKVSYMAYELSQEMNAKQLINSLLLETYNDTDQVCYALLMPKQTLVRLTTEESAPKPFTLKKLRDLFIETHVYGITYLDSCANHDKNRKAFLMNENKELTLSLLWEKNIKSNETDSLTIQR